MKIGFDGKRAFHNFRGLGNYSRNLIQGLLAQELVVQKTAETSPENHYIAFTPEYKDPRAISWGQKVPALEIVTPQGVVSKTMPALWRSQFMVKDLIINEIDLFHGLHHELPAGLNKAGIKSVVTVHDVLFLRFPQFHSKINRIIYKRKLELSCSAADIVIAISEQTKKDLIGFLHVPEEKIRVVYQSCEPKFFEIISDEKISEVKQEYQLPEKYLLYVGALTPSKNLEKLLEAYNELQLEIPDVHLVLAGVGGLEKTLKEQSVNWKIDDKVHFPGFIDNADLPALFKGAQIFVYPSLFEGFGIPIIEALASGVPVITSTDSCFAEAGGPGSKYVNPKDANKLLSEIKEVLDSVELQEDMVLKGKEYVKQFHPVETTKNMMMLYKELCAV